MNVVILTDTYYPNMSATSACIDKYIQILKNKHSIDIVCPLSQVHFAPLNDPKIKLHFIFHECGNGGCYVKKIYEMDVK